MGYKLKHWNRFWTVFRAGGHFVCLSASVSGRLGAERRALLRRARNSLISASLPCTTARSASTFCSTCATNLDNNNSTLPPFNDIWHFCNHSVSHLLQPHCNENPSYVLLFWELAASVPISTFMCLWSILDISRISPHIWLQQNRRPILEIYKSLTDIWV